MITQSVLYIFEGIDNTGKDTQISLLCTALKRRNKSLEDSDFVHVHWTSPTGSTDDEKKANFISRIKFEFDRIISGPPAVYIWNRSHLGEYVYGSMYRSTRPEEWLFDLEQNMLQDLDHTGSVSGVYLIHLDILPEHAIHVDDGLSYSTDLQDKINERFLFTDAVNLSSIPSKFSINVSSSEKNYIDQNLINHSIISFLYYKNDNISNPGLFPR